MGSMGLTLIIARVFGSLAMEVSGVQSVQFTLGEAGATFPKVLIGVRLWVLAGSVVGLGTGGCCGRIN